MNKAYEQEIEMWNQVFKECTPVDLRKLDLKVETMFDEALKLFAEKKKKKQQQMSWILDAEPEIFLHIRFWGLMPQKWVFNLQMKQQNSVSIKLPRS